MPGARASRAAVELRKHVEGDVLEQPDAVAPFARDFGGLQQRIPALVLRPRSEVDVVTALRIAAEHGLSVATRGAGHSQFGQGLGEGLVLDMTRLDRVLRVDPERSLLEVEAGASWRKVVDATFPLGWLPAGLTHALDPTVAGTLSVAGVGAESFRCGAQVDNVLFLDVALLGGTVARCSLAENRELFDAVRAGLGQCGVILRVGYPLRVCRRSIRVRCLGYRDPAGFLSDASALATADATSRWLTGTLAKDPVRAGGWLFVLFVGHDRESAASTPDALPTEGADLELPARELPTWTANGNPGHPFFRLFDPRPGLTAPATAALNPWVEHIFAPQAAPQALELLLERGPPVLARGSAGVIFVRRNATPAPLFVVPGGDLLTGIGMFASFAPSERADAGTAMDGYAALMQPLGGKRYLSGYVNHASPAEWAAHYGQAWDGFRRAKARYDAGALLNPGFIHWS
jgi:cytokinin dehydrogenase